MSSDFNLNAFLEELKACKPPYRCPFEHCGKVYKSSSGIIAHIQQCTTEKEREMAEDSKDAIDRPFFRSPQKDTLVYTESHKTVEFEADGRFHKFSIYDALQLVTKEDYEASLPEDFKEKMVKKEEEITNTPVSNKTGNRKKGKAPRFSTPKNPNLVPRNLDKATDRDDNKDIQPIDKKLLKLPEAQFREITNYTLKPATPIPAKYFKFTEKSPEELDKEVEYDMDEEDVAWLKIMNSKRNDENLTVITEDQFELLMDRLEKESYFQVASSGGTQNYNAPVDEDAICCVCMDGEATNTNVILFCDLCNLAVHQECYGVPYIPEGQWLCRRCLQSPSRSVECCLCPNKGGAFKQTDDGRWAHVVCGLWIPEVRFANTVFLEPIDSIANIPSARWKLPCRVCRPKSSVGACIQCHKNSCFAAFHVTCGLLAGLHMKMETVHESGPGGTSITVRKSAFCELHTPADSDAKPRLDDVASLGIVTSKNKKSPKKNMDDHPLPILFRGLMNFSPQCPWDKVQKIASMVDIQKKNQFIQRLMAYWTLKRQTRNGVPLIRRLQFAKATKSDKLIETPQKNVQNAITDKSGKEILQESEVDTDATEKKPKKEKKEKLTPEEQALVDFKHMADERRKMRRLRQDLERVRLLCELIRKREQRKREMVSISADIKVLELNPFNFFLRKILDILREQDVQNIFGEPVDPEEVPDYLDLIKKPMDFSTMGEKVENFKYDTVDAFERDFNLMVCNCLAYNEKDTIFYRAGTKMRDTGGSVLRQARRHLEQLQQMGSDSNSSLKMEQEELSDMKIMKEFDNFMASEELNNEERLQRLLYYSDLCQQIHHPVAKKKRLQLSTIEIRKCRRKMSMAKKGEKENLQKKGEKANTDVSGNPSSGAAANTTAEKSSKGGKKIVKQGKGRKRFRSSEEEKAEKEQDDEAEAAATTAEGGEVDEAEGEGEDVSGRKKCGKGIAGVNRRNAVLFTRKKAATEDKGDKKKKDKDRKEEPEAQTSEQTKKRRKVDDTNTNTTSSTTDKFQFHEPDTPVPASASTTPGAERSGPGGWRANRKTRKGREMEKSILEAKAEKFMGGPAMHEEMFQTYRQGGAVDTDTDTGAESTNDINTTDDDESSSDSGEDSYCGMSGLDIPLEPLDLVWAKCRGYPWYPALIINPNMPRTGYFHNGVPIPVPPVEVLNLAETHTKPHYLILFFDTKRTWQWLPRDKLEPLGVDTELDKCKLVQSRKPSEKKAVKKAYEEAILHRCRVTGETVDLKSCQTKSQDSEEDKEEKAPEKPKKKK